MNKTNTFLFIIFLFTICKLHGQVQWKSYSSGNEIAEMKLDGNTLWVATLGDGLLKINVKTGDTTVFQTTNSGITSDIVHHVTIDKSGFIYVTVSYGRINGYQIMRFDGKKTWKNISGLIFGAYDLEIDSSIILSVGYNGIYQIVNDTSVKLQGLPTDQFRCIAIDVNGNKWFGSPNRLIKYNKTVLATYDQTSFSGLSNGVQTILCDSNNVLWLGTSNGLIKFDGNNWTIWNNSNSSFSASTIYKITKDKSNQLWLGCADFIWKFNGTDFTVYKDTTLSIRGKWTAMDICIDSSGNKWVGTENAGLYKFNDISFTKQTTSNSGLPTPHGMTMLEDKKGKKWFATSMGIYGTYGLSSFDGVNWTYYTPQNSGFKEYSCGDITLDSLGNIWCLGQLAVYKFDGVNWTRYGLPYEYYKIKWHKGLLWVFGYEKARSFDGVKWTNYALVSGAIPNGIASDKKGNLWISANNVGAYCYDGVNFKQYGPGNSGIVSIHSTDVCVDSNDVVWISSSEGLSRFDGQFWETYTIAKKSPLPTDELDNVAVDKKNIIWISSISNLTRFDFDSTRWKNYNRTNSPVIFPRKVSFDNEGNKWIAEADQGFLFMKDDIITQIPVTDQLNTTVCIFPNPACDVVTVTFKRAPAKNYTFCLQTIQGQTVILVEQITSSPLKINLQGLSKGIYFYKIIGNAEQAGSGKLIIQ